MASRSAFPLGWWLIHSLLIESPRTGFFPRKSSRVSLLFPSPNGFSFKSLSPFILTLPINSCLLKGLSIQAEDEWYGRVRVGHKATVQSASLQCALPLCTAGTSATCQLPTNNWTLKRLWPHFSFKLRLFAYRKMADIRFVHWSVYYLSPVGRAIRLLFRCGLLII